MPRNHIAHQKYVGGPLNAKGIELGDWPDDRDYLIAEDNGEHHFYSRTNVGCLSAIYYLGVLPPRNEYYVQPLPYLYDNDRFLTGGTEAVKEFEDHIRSYINQFHERFIVRLEIQRERPSYMCTRVLHRTSSDEHLREFLGIARDLHFDNDHDEARR